MGHNEYWIGPGDDGYTDAMELDFQHDPKPEDWGNEYDVCGICGVPLTASGWHWPGYETDAQGGVWLPATSTAYDDDSATASRKTADFGTATVTLEISAEMPQAAAEWLADQFEQMIYDGTIISDDAYEVFGVSSVSVVN